MVYFLSVGLSLLDDLFLSDDFALSEVLSFFAESALSFLAESALSFLAESALSLVEDLSLSVVLSFLEDFALSSFVVLCLSDFFLSAPSLDLVSLIKIKLLKLTLTYQPDSYLIVCRYLCLYFCL